LSDPRPGGTVAGAVAGGDGFPAVPDVEFPQFRAAAGRLLAAPAFARVDHDTFGLARAQADDLRREHTPHLAPPPPSAGREASQRLAVRR
jgi:hypothetical protein